MEAIQNMCFVGTCLFLVYCIVSLSIFGVPTSLSKTFYLYNCLIKNLGWIFPIMLACVVFLIIPYWLEITPESYQFLGFISCFGLLMVFTSPEFEDEQHKTIHFVGAAISAVTAITWCMLQGQWLIILFMFAWFFLMAIITRTLKKCYLFWIELVAFESLFISLITNFFILK